MSYEYAQKRRNISAPGNMGGARATERTIPNSMRLEALKSGAAQPTAEEKGHQIDLQAAIRAKMESSFGADFSSVKLYESRAVADAGAEAVARGNEIAFAPGKADFSSQSGQALLGHELSHVASQSRGEVTGVGFLADSGLEAQADREGAMAARGESLYGGAVVPLSSASPASMAGPMQARKPQQPNYKGIPLIYTGNGSKGVGLKDYMATAFINMKSWFSGLNPFSKKTTHKDSMLNEDKDEVTKRANEEMKNMYDVSDASDEDLDAELEDIEKDSDLEDNEVYD